jgi:type VI secretion system ImpB/VipA family protein
MSKWSLSGSRVSMDWDGSAGEIEERPPLKILVLGDFSGRGTHRNPQERGVPFRPVIVDRDNFEQVLQNFNVRLDGVPIEPNGASGSVAIDSLDDFHPDSLLRRVAPLQAIRELRKRLADRATFAEAVQEAKNLLQPPQESQPEPESQSAPAPAASMNGGSLLDQMLDAAGESEPAPPRRLSEVERFAQQLMAAYSVPADDPRQEPWLEAVDQAAAFAIKQLIQHPRFRELEARWRSVDWLTRRVNSDVTVKIALVDICEQELRTDLDREDLRESALYELLVSRPKLQPAETPWKVIVVDQRLGPDVADIELLGRLSQIASDSNARLLVGLTDEVVGVKPSSDPFVPDGLNGPGTHWQTLRSLPDTQHASAVWPGFLLRQPYGKATSEVETLEFEELAGLEPQSALLYGNSAYLAADQLIRQREDEPNATDVTGLPCVVLPDKTGSKKMIPVARWWLSQSATEHLTTAGVTPVYPLPHAGALRVFPLKPLAIRST